VSPKVVEVILVFDIYIVKAATSFGCRVVVFLVLPETKFRLSRKISLPFQSMQGSRRYMQERRCLQEP